jgi:hypothetical protein
VVARGGGELPLLQAHEELVKLSPPRADSLAVHFTQQLVHLGLPKLAGEGNPRGVLAECLTQLAELGVPLQHT